MTAVIVSNALIAAAYLILAAVLVFAGWAPRPAVLRWVYWSFALFIFCCGVSHVLDDVTLWLPVYRLHAMVLCITTLISTFTVVVPFTFWIRREAERWQRWRRREPRRATLTGDFSALGA